VGVQAPEPGTEDESVTQARQRLNMPVAPHAAELLVRCWLRLYGIICVESMGQTRAIGGTDGALFGNRAA
jgi:hypothetical protein